MTLATLLDHPAPWLMGVLNLTPDSFSDGGRYATPELALQRAQALAAEGADILDVGGESTAPGAKPLSWADELTRIEPTVAALAPVLTLSIDTYHARTAARCLELGARLINDVSAARAEPEIADVVREHAATLILMYAKDSPLPHATDAPRTYRDVALEIADWLRSRVDWALSRGLTQDQLVVDPGISRFISVDPADSWRLLHDFHRLTERLRPIPVLIGTSRKGFLGVPLPERDPVSQLTALHAVQRGASLVRTHDVRMMRQFLEADARMSVGTRPEA